MPSANSNLRDLVEALPLVIVNINKSIDNIDTTSRQLLDQQQAIEQSVMALMTSASSDWIDWKTTTTYSGVASAHTSGGYGTTNLHDWCIVSAGTHPLYKLYSWGEVTSAGPQADNSEARQYNRQINFPNAYEHIHDDLSVDPGTYGIEDRISKLARARLLQVNNKEKYIEVAKIYQKYTSYPPTGV